MPQCNLAKCKMLKLIKTKDTRKLEVKYSHPDTGVEYETYVIEDNDTVLISEEEEQENLNYIINEILMHWKKHNSYYHNIKITMMWVYETSDKELECYSKVIYDNYNDIDLRKKPVR